MSDTVLLVGGGGREHAMAAALRGAMDRDDPEANDIELFACAENRNPGFISICDGFQDLDTTDTDAVVEYAEERETDLVVIGPEAPLAAGLVDALAAVDIDAFGPTAELARIETDKAYQREFMAENDIPGCPEFAVFDSPDEACAYIDEAESDLAVKPTGLTGGKGVKVIGDQVTADAAKDYIRDSDHDSFVLEERLVGEEFTIQAIVANGDVRVTPAVQDHKRAFEGDEGPNTGGMGSYSDAALELPFMSEDDYLEAVDILTATVDALEDYRGILYGQFMLTAAGVKVIEYNARFGDPEAMNTLPVMNTSFLSLIETAIEGDSLPQLSFAPRATVCKYAVPEGYPTDPDAGRKLDIDTDELDDVVLYYASVDEQDDGIYTTTSRAFAVVGIADTIAEAEELAESALEEIGLDGVDVRHDIGTESLIQERTEHIESIRE